MLRMYVSQCSPLVSYSNLSADEFDLVNAGRPVHVPGVSVHTYTSPVLLTADPGAVPFGAPTMMLWRAVTSVTHQDVGI